VNSDGDRQSELRHSILEIAKSDRPLWARAAILGREKALRCFDEDLAQCFRDADLLGKPISPDSHSWWESLAREIRQLQEIEQSRIGAIAEQLTLDYERRRLLELGIQATPYAVSLEDQTLGYDVRSYAVQHDGSVIPIFIEVKGTMASEAQFFLSKNEWNACLRMHPQYSVYVWEVNSCRLTVLTREDLKGHIPVDQGQGTWTSVRIPLLAFSVGPGTS
jgi:hypothetical protein